MEEKREYCVYKHTSKIDGRAYVGITRVGVENRWRNGGIGYKNQKYFWHYVKKHGWDSLEHEVLFDNLTEEEATTMERELIAKWDLTNRNKGFNLDLGGSTNNHFWKGVYCIETDKEYEGTRIAERETGFQLQLYVLAVLENVVLRGKMIMEIHCIGFILMRRILFLKGSKK